MKLTDDSPMPWGKYKGEKMANVPAAYLLWLYDSNQCSKDVKVYIKENYDVLEAEIAAEKHRIEIYRLKHNDHDRF